MKVLAINTYGGSLLLGAKAAKAEIIGSYEDVGFGTPIQAANFPDIKLIEKRKDWPAQDLSEVLVIAHPPCSAFSHQTPFLNQGINSEAFACTKHVLDYSMKNKAYAIAIESVMGACARAWEVHQKYADDNGYSIYRILINSAMFVPQWRERFWVIFIKNNFNPRTFTLTPNWQRVEDVTIDFEFGPAPDSLAYQLYCLKKKLKPIFNEDDWNYFFNQNHYGGIAKLLRDRKFPEEKDIFKICKEWIHPFRSSQLTYLNPKGLANSLLANTWWYMNGRNLSESAYRRLMGFPAGYIFPLKFRKRQKLFLSKGVVPQVATWIIQQIEHSNWIGDYQLTIESGEVADFRFKKKDWGQRVPLLRQWERPKEENELTADILKRIN